MFKDESYAAQLFTQSADLGHAEANLKMGEAYEHGLLTCPRDPALSIHFYTGAAMQGLPEAMMAVCAWYMIGAEPVLEKDEEEAYEWAKRAAEIGEFSYFPTLLLLLLAPMMCRLTYPSQTTQKPNTHSATLLKWALDAAVIRSKQTSGTYVQRIKATKEPLLVWQLLGAPRRATSCLLLVHNSRS